MTEDIQVQINIPNDNDGFALLKCELCGGFFKLRPSEIEDESVVNIWCPNCGLISNNYLTSDVIDFAIRIARNFANNKFKKEIRKIQQSLNGKGIEFRLDKNTYSNEEVHLIAGIEALEIQKYRCCKKEAKIKVLIKECGSYCPYCGVIYNETE